MEAKLTNIPCIKHPKRNIIYFCMADNCDQKLLCEVCYIIHTSTHSKDLHEANYFFKYEIRNIIESIKNFKLHGSWMLRQVLFETEQAFDKLSMKLSRKLTQCHEAKVQPFSVGSEQLEELLVELLLKFQKFYLSLNSNNNTDDSLKREELEKLIALLQKAKNYESLDDAIENITRFVSIDVDPKTRFSFPFNDSVIKSLKPKKYIENHAPVLWHSVELLPDKNMLVVGDLNGCLTLWSESEGFKKLFKIKAHNDWISNLKYSQSRNLVISGSFDQSIKVYKVRPGPSLKLICTLRHAPSNWIRGLLVLDEKDLFLSSGNLPNINVWDLNNFKLKGIIDTRGKGSTGAEMTYVSTFNLLAVGFLQGIIGLYDLKTNVEVAVINTSYIGCRINSMQFLERENLLIAGVAPGKIKSWKLMKEKAEYVREYEVPGRQPALILPMKDEESLLVASFTEEIYSLNLASGKLIKLPHTGLNECVTLKVIPRKKKLIIGDFGSRKIAIMSYE